MKTAAVAILLLALTFMAGATSLTLNYSVTPAGGQYEYFFTLIDTSMPAGTSIDWLVFGDSKLFSSGFGQFAPGGFLLTCISSNSPWTGLGGTGGSNNGPNLSPIWDGTHHFYFWTPNQNDSIWWTGTSATYVPDLDFSVIMVEDQAGDMLNPIEFQPANLVSGVPEPGTCLMIGIGIVALALLRRRQPV